MSDLRARIRYLKKYPANYLGHLDTVREIERAMRRAAWPFVLTAGFNPRVKMSAIPPISLGYHSRAEYLDVSLKIPVKHYQEQSFRDCQPAGLEIMEVKIISPAEESINDILFGYRYMIELDCEPPQYLPGPAKIKKKGEKFIIMDILKKDGNIKNPAKFMDRENFKKVVKTECLFKGDKE